MDSPPTVGRGWCRRSSGPELKCTTSSKVELQTNWNQSKLSTRSEGEEAATGLSFRHIKMNPVLHGSDRRPEAREFRVRSPEPIPILEKAKRLQHCRRKWRRREHRQRILDAENLAELVHPGENIGKISRLNQPDTLTPGVYFFEHNFTSNFRFLNVPTVRVLYPSETAVTFYHGPTNTIGSKPFYMVKVNSGMLKIGISSDAIGAISHSATSEWTTGQRRDGGGRRGNMMSGKGA
ncbi:hypothetical protein B0H13DRAFT_2271688 [Mycena leptocephala]|nr:hypothetical protein B0H13DRAFT_2271688 [Mycena leptocephala]